LAKQVAGSRPLYHRIADRLRDEIRASGWRFLPSLRTLSERYGVSLDTVTKASNVLRDQGTVTFSQGRRIRVVRTAAQGLSEESDMYDLSADKLYRKLRERIEVGSLRAGQSLPKFKYFVITEHVTDHTVSRAVKMLRDDNLVHKEGKRWIVGPVQQARPRASATQSPLSFSGPVVLVLLPTLGMWDLFFSRQLSPFASTFCSELDRHRILYVLVQKDDTSPAPRFLFRGRRTILDLINRLGSRYRGTIVLSQFEMFPALDEWIAWLSQFKQPVIWLDHDDALPYMDRRKIPRDNYFRCSNDEHAAVGLAVENLCCTGHSSIAVPMRAQYLVDGWATRRMRLIEEECHKRSPSLTVHRRDLTEDLWARDEVYFENRVVMADHVNSLLADLERRHAGVTEGRHGDVLRRELSNAFPSLATLLKDTKATAVLALNQRLAVNYYYWFLYAGYRIPRDLSLATFDNSGILSPHPISTINWGLDDLGYRAAHILIGDLPVRADKWGNVRVAPQFVDRGSIAPPSTSAAKRVRNLL